MDRPWDTAQGHLGMVPKTTHREEPGWGEGKLTVTCMTCPRGKASRVTDGEQGLCEGASLALTAKPGHKYILGTKERGLSAVTQAESPQVPGKEVSRPRGFA